MSEKMIYLNILGTPSRPSIGTPSKSAASFLKGNPSISSGAWLSGSSLSSFFSL